MSTSTAARARAALIAAFALAFCLVAFAATVARADISGSSSSSGSSVSSSSSSSDGVTVAPSTPAPQPSSDAPKPPMPDNSCHCHAMTVGVDGNSYASGGRVNPDGPAVVLIHLKWALQCTGGWPKGCTGTLKFQAPAGAHVLKYTTKVDKPIRNKRTGRLIRVDHVDRPVPNPLTCMNLCKETPSATHGTIDIRLRMPGTIGHLWKHGMQFAVTTTCEEGGTQVHKLDLQFTSSGSLDKTRSVLS